MATPARLAANRQNAPPETGRPAEDLGAIAEAIAAARLGAAARDAHDAHDPRPHREATEVRQALRRERERDAGGPRRLRHRGPAHRERHRRRNPGKTWGATGGR